VIGALLGMLAPALVGARGSGRAAVCMSNVRQLTLANDLHAEDHTGRYVAGAPEFRRNLRRWHGERDRIDQAFDPGRGAITPYLESAAASEGVRACPSFASTVEALREHGLGFEAGCGGYGSNNAFVGTERRRAAGGAWVVATDLRGSQRSWFASPSATVGFADAAFRAGPGGASGGLIEYSFAEARFWPEWPGARPDPSIHFRHGGGAKVAWLDGHVGAERMTFTWSSGAYREGGSSPEVGWFGERDGNELFDYE
jgi:prepilin-type processing-associated H-X9-DG protein